MAITMMLVCQSTEHDTQNPDQGNVYLTGVSDKDGKYKQFFSYTPYAELKAGILNPSAFTQIKPGKTYRLTLEQVEEE